MSSRAVRGASGASPPGGAFPAHPSPAAPSDARGGAHPWQADGTLDAAPPPWLGALLPSLPGVRRAALVGAGLRGYPAGAAMPHGTVELARSAAISRRVLRADVADGEIDELIAVPSNASDEVAPRADGSPDGARGVDVVVLGASALDARRRAVVVRRVREALRARTSADAPPTDRASVWRRTPAASAGDAAASLRRTAADGPGGRPAERSARRAETSREEAAEDRAAATVASGVAPARRVLPDDPGDGHGALADIALAAFAEHGGVRAAALALAEGAASRYGASRVAIGVRRGGATALVALSGEPDPDRRRATVRALERVMDETGERRPTDTACGADGASGTARVCARSSPGGVVVVAVLEGLPAERATGALERELRPSLVLVGALEGARRGARDRLLERCRDELARLRRGRPSRALAIAAVAALAVPVATLLPLPHEISARALIEASERQVITAPYAGHLRSARVRAGDTVLAGAPLATLDDRELVLERDRWDGEATKNRAEQAQALARHDRVELARLRADAERIAAERALLESRRSRGELRAPFDGVVLSGDPGRSLGAPLEAGEVLFELAASERRELLVEIDEHDVALVAPGAELRVRMAAEPARVRRARLGAIVPVAIAEPGGNVFRAPATLLEDAPDGSLRPGMQGVARIAAGRRSLAAAWTREARLRLRLLAWRLGLIG